MRAGERQHAIVAVIAYTGNHRGSPAFSGSLESMPVIGLGFAHDRDRRFDYRTRRLKRLAEEEHPPAGWETRHRLEY